MINSATTKYYQNQPPEKYLYKYLTDKGKKQAKLSIILSLFAISVIALILGISHPIFAKTDTEGIKEIDTGQEIYLQKRFEENIKNKYAGSYVNFPTTGIAHIKKTKYINSRPIKINIVELNTNVNPNLKIKPQIAGEKLNTKTTIRKIVQKENAIIAINGGFFKPQTGVPLGALMINGEILTGPIYNRVGIAIFENKNKTEFKMQNINFDMKLYTKNGVYKIDNINQPRMLSTYTLLYTSLWGQLSPVAPKDGLNMLVSGNKIKTISANQMMIREGEYVISAPKKVILNIIKNNQEIYLDIKLPENLQNAKHIIGAGPFLVKNSQVYVDYKAQKLEAIAGKNPRSSIGYKKDGTLIIVAVDGREKNSVGMTLYELANLMKNLGCEYAMNFDGGSSSAMYVKGKVVNLAVNKEGIPVSNALLVSEINDNLEISSL